jgi:hypothetical protein
LLERAADAFHGSGSKEAPFDLKRCIPKSANCVGERFLEGALTRAGLLNAKKMLDPAHELSLTKQATTLGISRGSISYLPQPVNDGGRV